MGKIFITLDTMNWKNSIYVPQSNGIVQQVKDADNHETSCWYIDSYQGRWTTLARMMDPVTQGDEVKLAFWVKYDKMPTDFKVEIMHRDYEKRDTYEISASSPYIMGRRNGYQLICIPHIIKESDYMTISLSVFKSKMTVVSAKESDLELFANVVREVGMISKIHPVVTLMKGENYGLCGCLAYVADCLGLPSDIYDFHYFAMATGDIFTQIHRDSLCDCTDCVSDYLFANDIIYRAYSATGYEYEYIDKMMIHGNESNLDQKIRQSIDRDVPVISAGFEGDSGYDFCIICGYTKDGKLKIMCKENQEPMIQENLLAHTRGLIFTGNCRHEMNLKQQFSNITKSIYFCVSRSPERECTFGSDAFRAWSDSLVNGQIANAATVDSWCSYAYNLCIAGTNGYAGTPMLKDILKKCPEFEETKAYPLLKKVCAQFDVQNQIFMELMQMGYGFELSEDKLRDVDFMRPAAEKILEFCQVTDKIVQLYPKELLEDNDFWNTDDYRIVNCFKELFPKCRFIGTCYKNKNRADGAYASYWGEFFEQGKFDLLEKLITPEFKDSYPNAEAYVSLIKDKNDADDYFEYWIGMFLPADSAVPEGFDFIDFRYDAAGICYVKGKEENVTSHEKECFHKMIENGMTILPKEEGGRYLFERYACPRYTIPDEYGDVILDVGFFVEKENKVKELSELKATEQGKQDQLEYFHLPGARVIGLSFRCPLDMRVANPIPAFWDQCAQQGLFQTVCTLPKLIPAMLGFTDNYEAKTNTFRYTCGVMCPKDTMIPTGYTSIDIPATIVSKSCYGKWLGECKPVWEADGFEWSDDEGQAWNSELYLDGEDNNGFRLLCAVRLKK